MKTTTQFHSQTSDVEGNGISAMPSRSQLAQGRELQRLRDAGYKWATQEWYDAKAEQQTVDGQVLCGDCGKPEPKRIKYGTPRPLTVDEAKERLICSKCDSKIRSQKARERIAAKVQATEPEPDTDLSRRNKQWKQNREELKAQNPERYADLYYRSEVIADLCASMSLYTFYWPLHGPFYSAFSVESANELPELLDQADLQTTINRVVVELRTRGSFNALNGTINVAGSPINMPGAQRDKDYEQFGFITRLPEWHPYDNGSCFEVGAKRFIQRFAPELEAELYPAPMFKKKCGTNGCPHFYLYGPSTIQPPYEWFCDSCRAKSAAQKPVRNHPSPEDQLYTVNGVMKDGLRDSLPIWLTR